MPILDGDQALAVAERVLDASTADETEVTVESVTDRFVRYADVGPTQNADRERVDVSVRVRYREGEGFREARARGGGDEASALGALGRATALARQSPANVDAAPLGGAVEVAATAPVPATLDHGFEDKARWVGRAVEACAERNLKPAGILRTTGISRAVANSAGRAVHGFNCRASFSLTATGASGSGFGERIAADVGDVDADAVVARAVGKAASAQNPVQLEAGEYTVVLEPSAVSSILLFAAYQGFGAREVEEQASFLCGRVGERVFSERLTIADDACNPIYPGMPFDGEGAAKTAVTLIDRGLLKGPVTDAAYARKLGVACTGHAQPQPSEAGPAPENLVVSAGEESVEQLIAGVGRGLLVTQFHYTNMIEPRELTLTGMTRNGTYLIENGEIAGAVKNLRFTETLVNAFSRVSGVSLEREVAGALFDGEVVAPTLRIDGFRFTSTTDF